MSSYTVYANQKLDAGIRDLVVRTSDYMPCVRDEYLIKGTEYLVLAVRKSDSLYMTIYS